MAGWSRDATNTSRRWASTAAPASSRTAIANENDARGFTSLRIYSGSGGSVHVATLLCPGGAQDMGNRVVTLVAGELQHRLPIVHRQGHGKRPRLRPGRGV